MTRTGFFTPALSSLSTLPELTFIQVSDDPFCDTAVALLDPLKKSTHPEKSLKPLADKLLRCYPQFKSMDFFLNRLRKSETPHCLAYVLRQMAMDEIYSHYLDYKEVFEGLDSSLPKQYLRNPGTPISFSALPALTKVLPLTLILSYVEPDKSLRVKEVYSNEAQQSQIKVELQIQGKHCFPGVTHKADYAYVGKLAIQPPEPVEQNPEEKGETLVDIIEGINQDNHRFKRDYLHMRRNLQLTVAEHQLSSSNLIQLYSEFLPPTYNRYANNRNFFHKLMNKEATPQNLESIAPSNTPISEGIINALAAWVSAKSVDEEAVFERMEQLVTKTPGFSSKHRSQI